METDIRDSGADLEPESAETEPEPTEETEPGIQPREEEPIAEPRRMRLSPDRLMSLFLRLLILTILFVVPLIFFTGVKRNFSFVKFMSLRYLAFLALLVWLAKPKKPREWRSPARFPWLVYLFGALLSTLAATNIGESFDVSHVPDIVAFFVFFHVAYQLAHSVRFIHLGICILALATSLLSLYGILQALGLDRGVFKVIHLETLYFGIPYRRPITTMGNFTHLASFLVCVLPLFGALFLSARSVFGKIASGAAVFLTLWCLIAAKCNPGWFGFWWAVLIGLPVACWLWPARAKRLLLWTALGSAVLGGIQGFSRWWSASFAYGLAVRYPDWMLPPDSRLMYERNFDELSRRYVEGKEQFAQHWMESATGLFVAAVIVLLVVVYFGLIPLFFRGTGGPAERLHRFRRRLLMGMAALCVIAALVGISVYVDGQIDQVNRKIAAGETVRKHHYARVQPNAEHPYALEHYLLDTFLGQWTFVFRVECWKAAAENLTDNIRMFWGVPVFGIGPGNFKLLHPIYASQLERKLLGREVLARKVRCEWLRAGLECGLFGVLGLFWLFAVVFYCWWLAARRWRASTMHGDPLPNRNLLYSLLIGSFAALVGSMAVSTVSVTFILSEASTAIYFVGASVCAMVPILARRHRREESPQPVKELSSITENDWNSGEKNGIISDVNGGGSSSVGKST